MFLLSALPCKTPAQPADLSAEIARLEAKFGLPPGRGRPIIQRLNEIELRVFGIEQYGPLMPRFQRLDKTPPGNLVPKSANLNPSPGPAPIQPFPIQSVQTVTPPASPTDDKTTATGHLEATQSEPAKNLLSGDAFRLANAFPLSLVRTPAAHPEFAAVPDYYNEVKKASRNKSIHFKAMPIPVYIQPFPDRDFVNCVIRAFESWEQRTNGAVRFQQIDNSETARIRVYWKHLGSKSDDKGCVLGAHTILKYTDRGSGNLSFVGVGAVPVPVYVPRFGPKYSVPPQVMEVNLDLIGTKDYSIRYRCLQNIVTHELGHALGLLGHSPCPADIMYPITDEHSRLSQRDLNTLIKLYETKVDIPL